MNWSSLDHLPANPRNQIIEQQGDSNVRGLCRVGRFEYSSLPRACSA